VREMTFKKTEKEIIKTIVKYGGDAKSLAVVVNESELFEKKGIVVVFDSDQNYLFFDKQKYDWDDKKSLGYITELISLLKYLIQNRLITILPTRGQAPLVIGRKISQYVKLNAIETDDAIIWVGSRCDWMDKMTHNQTYWPNCYSEKELPLQLYLNCWFSVSQELEDLVKNGFKSEEQVRFQKQQCLTWISIFVAAAIGIAGLIIGIINIIH